MTARRANRATRRQHMIRVDTVTFPRTAIVTGPVQILQPRLRALAIGYQYDAPRHGFRIPIQHVDDLCAALETLDRCRVDLVMAGWS